MAFTLETIFSSRPARQSSESGTRPPTANGKGADFAKNLSGLETDPRDGDETDLANPADAGQLSAAAIPINAQPDDDTLAIADDAALLTTETQTIPTGDQSKTPDIPLAADTVDVPEVQLGQVETDPAELTEAKLEQPAADSAEAPEPQVEELAAYPEELAVQGESDADATTVQPAPLVPAPAPADASSPPDKDIDSPPEADIAALPGTTDPALQSTLASAISPAAGNAQPTPKNTDKLNAVPSASKATPLAGEGVSPKDDKPARTSAHDDTDLLTPAARTPTSDTTADTATTAKAVIPQDMAISAQSGLQQAPTTQAPASPVLNAMTATHSLISASPAQVIEIISDSIAAPEDRKDRIHIQLDPPELGRVSIDFKFDANGLQHVTVTGETPEALRQLRAMHFELVNALERQGLSSQNMSFQQQQTQQDSGQQAARSGQIGGDIVGDADLAATAIIAASNSQPRSTAAGSLNIKL